jgi:A/G-specific adenine glycosylase
MATRRLTPAEIKRFRRTIYAYYRRQRRPFPWRDRITPYGIVVSEIMLQQTQTSRVITKYREFMQTWPTFAALAQAPTNRLMQVWHGLGYNRRALALRRLAQVVVTTYHGKLPQTSEELDALPGIGAATAGSIRAFAFDLPAVFIETNVRTVFIHFFFPRSRQVSDHTLLPLVEQTLDRRHPRDWYYALMDYGVMLKKTTSNPSRRSKHYSKQSPFGTSNRRIRGLILKTLLTGPHSAHDLSQTLAIDQPKIDANLFQLHAEGFLVNDGDIFTIHPE